jgi:hypothetical protein
MHWLRQEILKRYRRLTMKKRYRSEIAGVLYEDAQAMHKIGAITDAQMREYDADCLLPASRGTGNPPLAAAAPRVRLMAQAGEKG